MENGDLSSLFAAAARHSDLAERLGSAKDVESIQRMLEEAGVDSSVGMYLANNFSQSVIELPESELEAVAGGICPLKLTLADRLSLIFLCPRSPEPPPPTSPSDPPTDGGIAIMTIKT